MAAARPISFDGIVADGYELVVDEQFDGDALDRRRWLPYYLPQWAGRANSAARHRLDDGRLLLFIDADQPPWLPHILDELRVSSIQTGCFSGPEGSRIGQHRTHESMSVIESQPTERLITPQFAAIEMRASWVPDPDHMVALWMIGFEDEPERSAEICICELFGSEAQPAEALVGNGVHPFGDPNIVDDFDKTRVAIDVREPHDYAMVWAVDRITFFIDGAPIRTVSQSPRYPMQLMLNIYRFGPVASGSPVAAPFVVDRVRVFHERAADRPTSAT